MPDFRSSPATRRAVLAAAAMTATPAPLRPAAIVTAVSALPDAAFDATAFGFVGVFGID